MNSISSVVYSPVNKKESYFRTAFPNPVSCTSKPLSRNSSKRLILHCGIFQLVIDAPPGSLSLLQVHSVGCSVF